MIKFELCDEINWITDWIKEYLVIEYTDLQGIWDHSWVQWIHDHKCRSRPQDRKCHLYRNRTRADTELPNCGPGSFPGSVGRSTPERSSTGRSRTSHLRRSPCVHTRRWSAWRPSPAVCTQRLERVKILQVSLVEMIRSGSYETSRSDFLGDCLVSGWKFKRRLRSPSKQGRSWNFWKKMFFSYQFQVVKLRIFL